MPYADKNKAAEYNKAYREKHKEQLHARAKSYRETNKENIAAYRKANREAIREYMREYIKEWYARNRDSRREYALKMYYKHIEKRRADGLAHYRSNRAIRIAKCSIAHATGLSLKDIPDELLHAKCAQIEALHEIKKQKRRLRTLS